MLLDLHSALAFGNSPAGSERFLGQMIRLRVGGIDARLHIVFERLHRVADHRAQIGVAANELGRRREGQSQQIVEDQHLAIAIRAGADADGRDLQFVR